MRLVPFQGWRLTFFQGIIIAVFAIFAIRMYDLQIVRQDDFEVAADDNRLKSLPIATTRGAIFDRNDQRMAFNVPAYNVTIVPAELPASEADELEVFNRISALVDVPPTREVADAAGREEERSIEELVREGEGIAPFRAVTIAQDVSVQVASQILEERIYMPGVDVNPIAVREYPQVVLDSVSAITSSHVVGYLGPIGPDEAEELREQGYDPAFDRIGYEGVERFLERQLSGERGEIIREVDVAGEEIRVVSRTEPQPGQNVRLTIDMELQAFAEERLIEGLRFRNEENPNFGFRGISSQGVVIAMDPSTGEILALVSWPTYDNTRFARAIDAEYYLQIIEDESLPLINNTIKGLYPPGSVWKLITAAGVLEEEVIDPQTQLFDEGQLIVENRYAPNDPAASQRFVCWLREGHEFVNMIQSLAWSCDVYYYQVGGGNPEVSPLTLRQGGLGINDLFRYSTSMGIGTELGIELPFESAGRMPDPDWKRRNYGENWSTGDTYNAAFGQGYVTVTPLQLIVSVSSIVNGGILYQPTIIQDILDSEGNAVTPFEPHVMRTVNPAVVAPDEPLTLLMVEDMLIHGENSLVCTCEPTSGFYDAQRCDPDGYRNMVDMNSDPFVEDLTEYQVHVPLNYVFNGQICQPIRFSSPGNPYQPAFVSSENLELVREGMYAAVYLDEGATARSAGLTLYPEITVAGKTGTAEYCDDIARPLGYCVPGNWPAHAWYTGYAPYENPEILIIGFVYNGGEGSQIALPIVRDVMDEYFRLKDERLGANVQQN